MTSFKEFIRFRVYRQIEPWGDDWDQSAIIAATVANSMRSKGRALKKDDFRPVYKRRSRQTDDEIATTLRAFFEVG
jgi:hypothetical protein